jgi:hypothetical protein
MSPPLPQGPSGFPPTEAITPTLRRTRSEASAGNRSHVGGSGAVDSHGTFQPEPTPSLAVRHLMSWATSAEITSIAVPATSKKIV